LFLLSQERVDEVEMVVWEVTDKELTQGPEGAKAVMEAVVSLVEMAAMEAKVAMEGLALQVVMVEMAAMVENQRDHPSQPPPVRVSPAKNRR